MDLVTALLLSPGCLSRREAGYVGNFADAVLYLEWTENEGSLNGQLQITQVEDTQPPAVDAKNLSFTGTLQDDRVSLTFEEFFGLSKRTITGHFSRRNLELTLPDEEGALQSHVLKPGPIEDYNKLATRIRARVSDARRDYEEARTASALAENQRAKEADLGRQLQRTYEALTSSTDTLREETGFSDVLEAFARDWSNMQQEYRDMTGASDCSDVEYGFSSVEYAYSTIEYDMSSMEYERDKIHGYIRTVEQERSDLSSAFAATESGGAAAVSKSDVDSLLARSQNQLKASQASLNSAQAKADDYKRKGSQLLEDARNYERENGC